MQKKRHLSSSFVGLALLAAAHGASAIGWVRAQQSAVLGQPLDFTAALRLDAGDTLPAECVSAEVMVGDSRLSASAVRVLVDNAGADTLRLRVLSTAAIDEPVVAVTLAIGCPARMSRRFVLLADPPPLAAPALAAAPLAGLPLVTQAPPDGAPPARASAATGAGGVAGADAAAAADPAAPPSTRATAAEPRTTARAADAPRRPVAPRPRPPAPAPAPAPARVVTAAAPASEPAPRLRLDAAEPPPTAATQAVEEAIEAVAAAASAARGAAVAAAAADARIAALERSLAEMRAESRANRDLVTQLRDRLGADPGFSRWSMPLLLASLALALLAAWLAWRLRSLQNERQAAWRRAAAADAAPRPAVPPVPVSQLPTVTSELHLPPAPAPQLSGGARGAARVAAWPTAASLAAGSAAASGAAAGVAAGVAAFAGRGADTAATRSLNAASLSPAGLRLPVPPAGAQPLGAPPPRGPGVAHEHAQPLPPVLHTDADSARDVSIDELLDLEQQAEFFIVLGQDEAAIDLLVDHLRNTGGGSPLPYLKLLEIYRRRDEREAYERTRTRFNHRFNAYAPDWEADLQQGRTLEDHAGLLPRLQQVWPRPLDAMAELEALLFRKSRGELFELPAYREVLFLYSLARDLLDREAVDTGSVDLLLPLADGGEFSATSPHPYFGLERESVFDAAAEDRPTAPVDLDLTQPEAPSLISGPRGL